MADYGLKISQDGVDVGTATDRQLVFKSDLKTLKDSPVPSPYQSGSFTVTRSTGITYYIPHNFGHTPMVKTYFDNNDGVWHESRNSQTWAGFLGPSYSYIDVYVNNANVYFRIPDPPFLINPPVTFRVKFYLFKNQG